ncbi:MAG: hypothetical protein WCG14_07340 [Chlamydiia bacterium]
MFDEKQYRKDYYLKNKGKILDRQKKSKRHETQERKDWLKEYYSSKEGRIVRFLAGCKKRAKAKNLPFDLDLAHLRSIAPDKCPVFGFDLDWTSWGERNQKAIDNSPSVDKIDPNKGYVKGNVVWISWKANRLKNNANFEDLFIIAFWLKKLIESEQNNGQQTNSTTSSISQHTNGAKTST